MRLNVFHRHMHCYATGSNAPHSSLAGGGGEHSKNEENYVCFDCSFCFISSCIR